MKSFCDALKQFFTNGDIAYKYFKMTLFLLLIAFCYNLFILPIDLVAGGSGGIGVLFNYVFDIDPALVVFVFSIFVFILAFIFLDGEQILSAFFVSLFFPLFIKYTSYINSLISLDKDNILVMVLFGAIITGFAQGHILKLGLNFGGTSIISRVICRGEKLSVSLVNAIINGIIVIIGGYVLGFSMVLYAVAFLIVSRTVSERVILGRSKSKTFKVITSKHKLVEHFIEKELGHDVTIYKTFGAYNGDKTKLLMSVVPTSEFTLLRDYIKSIDKKAFVFITDTYALGGEDKAINKSY